MSLPSKRFVLLLIAALWFATGCVRVEPPIQEMSDARLAIKAAEQAGAEKFAADSLDDARALLRSAERNLGRKAYQAARRDAGLVKQKATEAREIAERESGKPNRMTEQPLKEL